MYKLELYEFAQVLNLSLEISTDTSHTNYNLKLSLELFNGLQFYSLLKILIIIVIDYNHKLKSSNTSCSIGCSRSDTLITGMLYVVIAS